MLDILRLKKNNNGIRQKVRELIPDGNLSACLTCGACAGGCPATGLMDMDPRKFLRMAVLGLDEKKDTDTVVTCDGVDYIMETSLLKEARPVVIDFAGTGFALKSSLELGGGTCSSCGQGGSCCD